MRKFSCILFMLFCFCRVPAQTRTSYWNVGFNPFSPGESLSSIGPCAELRVSPVVGFWAEGSYIFHNLYKIAGWQRVKGFRFIFQPRFYLGNDKVFFIAPELRIKRFNYSVALSFINEQTQDTLNNYFHLATQFQTGGALVIGSRSWLSRKHNLLMEVTGGIGGKVRQIIRRNIPAGFSYNAEPGGFGFAPHYEWDNDGMVYFPLCVRLVWKLDRLAD